MELSYLKNLLRKILLGNLRVNFYFILSDFAILMASYNLIVFSEITLILADSHLFIPTLSLACLVSDFYNFFNEAFIVYITLVIHNDYLLY